MYLNNIHTVSLISRDNDVRERRNVMYFSTVFKRFLKCF